MTRNELCDSNIAAWNNHDPEAFAANFVAGGLYVNPDFPEGITVEPLKEFMRKIFASSSDWKIKLVSNFDTENEQIGEWIVSGTNDGPNVDGNESTSAEYPSSIGNQLCCADLRRTAIR